MVDTIHSAIRGRGRYKVQGLYRSQPLRSHLELHLPKTKQVFSVSANIRTGNVLVIFHPEASHAEIASLLQKLVSQHAGLPQKKRPLKTHKSSSSQAKQKRAEIRRLLAQAQEQPQENWHLQEAGEVAKLFGADAASGLSEQRAQEHAKKYGPIFCRKSSRPAVGKSCSIKSTLFLLPCWAPQLEFLFSPAA